MKSSLTPGYSRPLDRMRIGPCSLPMKKNSFELLPTLPINPAAGRLGIGRVEFDADYLVAIHFNPTTTAEAAPLLELDDAVAHGKQFTLHASAVAQHERV